MIKYMRTFLPPLTVNMRMRCAALTVERGPVVSTVMHHATAPFSVLHARPRRPARRRLALFPGVVLRFIWETGYWLSQGVSGLALGSE